MKSYTTQKMKFAIKNFFSKCDQIRNFLWIQSYLPWNYTILTTITCKKIPYYMHDSDWRWCIAENAKIYWSYVKSFWKLPRVRKEGSQLVYINKFLPIFQSYFLTETIKKSSASFCFKSFMKKAYKLLKKLITFTLLKCKANQK